MQKFLDFISSKSFRNVMCFILFTFLMSVTISSQNYFFQKVIENGISKKDIVAQKDIKVIDTKKTEQHKKEVAQKVDYVLTPAEDDFIKTNLDTLQNSIMQIRKKDVPEDVKREELSLLFDMSNQERKDFVIYFLLKSEDSDLREVFDKANLTLANVLRTGITEKDYERNNIDKIIHKEILYCENSQGDSLIVGKSDSGRVLVSALIKFAQSYENYNHAKWLEMTEKAYHNINK